MVPRTVIKLTMNNKRNQQQLPKRVIRRRPRRARRRNNRIVGNNAPSRLVRAPIAQGSIQRQSGNNLRVRRREYVGDILGSVGFETTSYVLSPSALSTFPWLSGLTDNYECFKFHDIHFEYVPSCASTTAGLVMMAVDYDDNDAAPPLQQQMLQYSGAVSGPPWAPFDMCAQRENLSVYNKYFIDTGNSSDGRLATVGNLFIGTSGFASTDVAGQLYITYDVDLITPQISSYAGQKNMSSTDSVSLVDMNWWYGSWSSTFELAECWGDPEDQITTGTISCKVAGDYMFATTLQLSATTFIDTLTAPSGNSTITVERFFSSDGGYQQNSAVFYVRNATVGSKLTFPTLEVAAATGTFKARVICAPITARAANAIE